MTPNINIKDLFITLSDTIDSKLKTPTGRLTLVILNCLLLGGATVHSCNASDALSASIIRETKATTKKDSLQNVLNHYIATENERCNDNLEKGALLQQKMQVIYSQKAKDNYSIAEQNEKILKQKEATAKAKLENIKTLTKLNEQSNE